MTVLSYMARQRANLRARHEGETFVIYASGTAVRAERESLQVKFPFGGNLARRADDSALAFVRRGKEEAFNRAERSERAGEVPISFSGARMSDRGSDMLHNGERSAADILSELENLTGLNKRERAAYHCLSEAERA